MLTNYEEVDTSAKTHDQDYSRDPSIENMDQIHIDFELFDANCDRIQGRQEIHAADNYLFHS